MAARFVVSCTTTLKPAERTCSTQFAQQPHVALLYTVITGGGPTTSERAPSAPPSVTAATPSVTTSQVVLRSTECKEPGTPLRGKYGAVVPCCDGSRA